MKPYSELEFDLIDSGQMVEDSEPSDESEREVERIRRLEEDTCTVEQKCENVKLNSSGSKSKLPEKIIKLIERIFNAELGSHSTGNEVFKILRLILKNK
ncbi:unnamed protein product [Meloidogyne enterolobii]|uniref:Uncharacterized protein n=1 Tax=Meloidogyne enterolobii TaxID=390850 RepID=A0ACB0XQ50_MELEN